MSNYSQLMQKFITNTKKPYVPCIQKGWFFITLHVYAFLGELRYFWKK